MKRSGIAALTLLTAGAGLCFACGSEPATDAGARTTSTEIATDPVAPEPVAQPMPDQEIPEASLFSEADSEPVEFEMDLPENRPPTIISLSVAPSGTIRTGDDVTAMAKAEDLDEDPITFHYRWKVNSRPVSVDGATLPSGRFERGDRIELTVEADDGEDTSFPMSIEPILVANSDPLISSSPGPLDPDGTFRYKVEVEDPDSDRGFRYELRDPPDGMRIDPIGGAIAWTPRPDQAGVHSVTVAVDDRHEGAATQSFDLTIEFEGAAPPAAVEP